MSTDKKAEHALGILTGCPNGATYHALERAGVDMTTLVRLVAEGHVTERVVRMANPSLRGMKVTWFDLNRD